MFLLHYIFLSRLNAVIASFVVSWNKHPLRTEGNWSPERIWLNGMIDKRNNHQCQVADVYEQLGEDDLAWYGVDPQGPIPGDDDPPQVDLDDVSNPFTPEEMAQLQQIDVLRESNCYGLDIFNEAISLL